MEKRNKIRLMIIGVFAVLAILDMVSTYLALSSPGASEANPVGRILLGLGWGLGGYVLFFIYLLSVAVIMLGVIEAIFYINEKYLNIKLPIWAYSLICIYVSIMASIIQISAIIGNIGMAIQ